MVRDRLRQFSPILKVFSIPQVPPLRPAAQHRATATEVAAPASPMDDEAAAGRARSNPLFLEPPPCSCVLSGPQH